MKSKTMKIVIVIAMFIISLFSSLFSNKVSAWKIPELESPDYEGPGKRGGILARLQYAANHNSSNYYDFNAQNLVNHAREENMDPLYGPYAQDLRECMGAEFPGWVCADPVQHKTATTLKIVAVMDVDKNGDVTVYTPGSVKKTTHEQRPTAVDIATEMAYCAYTATSNGSHVQKNASGKWVWPLHEHLIGAHYMGKKFHYLNNLGVPTSVKPTGKLQLDAGTQQRDKEAAETIHNKVTKSNSKYKYIGRFIFLNGYHNGSANGQNTIIFRGDRIEEEKPKIKIVKVDSDTGKKLKGAKFDIYKITKTKSGNTKETLVKKGAKTTSNGTYIMSKDLKVGDKYKFVETEPPSGYQMPKTNTKTITLKAGENTVTIKNQPYYGMQIKKVDKDNTNKVLQGAVFRFKNTNKNSAYYGQWLYKKKDSQGNITYGHTKADKTTDKNYAATLFKTTSKGLITVRGLKNKNGVYTAYEIEAPKGYALNKTLSTKGVQIKLSSNKVVIAKNKKGEDHSLSLVKLSSKTNKPVAGVGFQIKNTTTNQYLQKDGTLSKTPYEFTTNSKGEINVLNIKKKDAYSAIETKAPEGYQKLEDPIPLEMDTKNPVVIYNKPKAKGKVQKVIKNSGNVPVKGLEFGIKEWEPSDQSLKTKPRQPVRSDYEYTDSEGETHFDSGAYQAAMNRYNNYYLPGYTFYIQSLSEYVEKQFSKEDGEIKFEFPKTVCPGTYTLYEIGSKNPYFLVEDAPKKIQDKFDEDTELTIEAGNPIENDRTYVDIEGIVFVDKVQEKTSKTNNVYDEGEGVNGVRVILKKNGQVVEEIASGKNSDGGNVEKGHYKFLGDDDHLKIRVDQLKQYSIEFEYNGVKYQSIKAENVYNPAQPSQDTYFKNFSSKAIEKDTVRKQFNDKFSTVSADTQINGSGKSTNKSKAGDTINYQYEQEGSLSRVVYKSSDERYSDEYYSDNIYHITSSTENIGLDLSQTGQAGGYPYDPGKDSILGINLGLNVRELPDVAIASTLSSAEVSLNGYAKIYDYSKRSPFITDGSAYDVEMKKSDATYIKEVVRELYESDVLYSDKNRDNPANVYLTYKVALKNQSSSLDVIVNEVVDYYHKHLNADFINAGTQLYDRGSIDKTTSQQQLIIKGDTGFNVNKNNQQFEGSDQYYKGVIATDMQLNAGESKEFYVQVKLKLESLLSLIEHPEGFDIENIVEINKLTAKKKGETVPALDIDSAVGNSIPNKKAETLEDDTDWAESIRIKLSEEKRKIDGIVFEDKTDGEFKTNEERKGNGIYDAGEQGIPNVTVNLVDIDTGRVATRYDDYRSDRNYENVTQNSGSNGEYNLDSFIPGNYIIVYTYGNDDKYKAQQYKATIYGTEGDNRERAEHNYQSDNKDWYSTEKAQNMRYSDAIDNYIHLEDGSAVPKYSDMRSFYDTIDGNTPISGTQTRTQIEQSDELYKYNDGNVQHHRHNTEVNKIQIDAFTAHMGIGVEEKEYSDHENKTDGQVHKLHITNIDFGIVERPRYKVSIDKVINRILLKKNDGSVIKDIQFNNGQIEEPKPSGVVYMPQSERANKNNPSVSSVTRGMVDISLDTELLQGAQAFLEYGFTVKNLSELEYNTYNYYQFAEVPEDIEANIVKLSVTNVLDYVDNDVKFDGNSPMVTDANKDKQNTADYGWSKVEWNDDIKEFVNNTVYDALKSENGTCKYNTVLDGKGFANTELKPNDTMTINLLLQTDLSSTQQEMKYDNFVEIVEVTKKWGREIYAANTPQTYGQTLGSLNVSEINPDYSYDTGETRQPDVSYTEQITIHPPTGKEDNNNILYVMIATGTLIMIAIATGVVCIVKKRKK